MDSPIYSLPDDCLCHVMSFTSPRDVYNFSLASTYFRSVVDSDVIWQAFLPSDYDAILSRTVHPVIFTSKKDLFFKLSESHVLIDGGKMSFGLERSSAAKCYMISTRLLKIHLASFHWRRISLPNSRFREAQMRIFPNRLGIAGKINSNTLSSKIRYGAYLVYNLGGTCEDISYTIGKMRQQTSVTVAGTHMISKSIVFLEPFNVKYTLANPRVLLNTLYARKVLFEFEKPEPDPDPDPDQFDNNIEILAKKRNDGWIEVEMGTFYIDHQHQQELGEVEINLQAIEGSLLENEIIIQGIEIRPA